MVYYTYLEAERVDSEQKGWYTCKQWKFKVSELDEWVKSGISAID